MILVKIAFLTVALLFVGCCGAVGYFMAKEAINDFYKEPKF